MVEEVNKWFAGLSLAVYLIATSVFWPLLVFGFLYLVYKKLNRKEVGSDAEPTGVVVDAKSVFLSMKDRLQKYSSLSASEREELDRLRRESQQQQASEG